MAVFSGIYDLPNDPIFILLGLLLHNEFDQAAMPIKQFHILPPFRFAVFGVPWVYLSVLP